MKLQLGQLGAAVLLAGSGLVSAQCAADDCLRALRATQTQGRLSTAKAFCATFTSAVVPASAIPTFAAEFCGGENLVAASARISSACSCIATLGVTSSSSSSIPSITPTKTTTTAIGTTPAGTATEACGIVSSLWSKSSAAATSFVQGTPQPIPTVAAALAYECLNSIPLDKTGALELVDSIRPYLEWQSGNITFAMVPSI
jgi:hypothetical protein